MRQICVRFASDNYDRWLNSMTVTGKSGLKEISQKGSKRNLRNWKKNKEDTNVKELLEKIKCHEWVEVIEGRDERKGKENINRGQEVFD